MNILPDSSIQLAESSGSALLQRHFGWWFWVRQGISRGQGLADRQGSMQKPLTQVSFCKQFASVKHTCEGTSGAIVVAES